MMTNTTEDWIANDEVREQLLGLGPLGVGIFDGLVAANEGLVELVQRRKELRARLRALIALCKQLDDTHDRKARGLFFALDGMIQVSDDPQEVTALQRLQAKLYPAGLSVTRLPYVEEGGAARQLAQEIGPEARAQLAALAFGNQTLEQVFDDWIRAGRRLGRATNQRARIEASLRRKGKSLPSLDLSAGRNRWIKAVRGLLWALDSQPGLAPIIEPVESTLHNAIAIADRRRAAKRAAKSLDELDALVEEVDGDADEGPDEDELLLDEEAQDQLLDAIERELESELLALADDEAQANEAQAD